MTFSEGSRIDPSRVQRRGRGATGGLAIGGGIGGALLILLFMLLGGDPGQLGGFGGPPPPQDETSQEDFEARCDSAAAANEYADCRVVGALTALDVYWAEALPAAGFSFDIPGAVVFDEATSSGCGTATSSTGPFYCPPDQTLYIDVAFYDSLAKFGFEAGALAEMYVIAHEYGHHIENLMGVFAIADRAQTGPDSDTVRVELMADCLAGAWVGHAATVPDPATGVPFLEPITPGQLDTALAAAEAVGDDRIQETIQGEAEPHTFTHGTSEQRRQAFMFGYENGTVTGCDLFGLTDRPLGN